MTVRSPSHHLRRARLLIAAASALFVHSALAAPPAAPSGQAPRPSSAAGRLEDAPAGRGPLPLTAPPPATADAKPAPAVNVATSPLTARGVEGATAGHAPVTVTAAPLTVRGRPVVTVPPLRVEPPMLAATGKRNQE